VDFCLPPVIATPRLTSLVIPKTELPTRAGRSGPHPVGGL
jgi:hypothetical protein